MEVFEITTIGKCDLSTASCPDHNAGLEKELEQFKDADVFILSLLSENDVMYLHLEQEGKACENLNIVFQNYPIVDLGNPVYKQFVDLVEKLYAQMKNYNQFVVHCQHGIGRSSTVAIGLMLKSGISLDRALELAKSARGMTVPQSRSQKELLSEYFKNIQV